MSRARASWPLRRRLTATYVVTAVVLAVVVALTSLSLVRLDRALVRNSDRLSPARATELRYFSALLDEQSGVSGYALTGNPASLMPYRLGRSQQAMLAGQLEVLLHGEPALLSRLAEVEARAQDWTMQYAVPAVRAGADAQQAVQANRGMALFDRVRVADAAFGMSVNAARVTARTQVTDDLHLLLGTLAASMLLILLLLVLIAFALRRWVTAPLRRVAADARMVAAGELGHAVEPVGPPDTTDLARDVESMRVQLIAELTGAREARAQLQTQADELARSNRDLEQFAYVASHDLQEPLRKVASFCQLLERRYGGQLDERADTYIGFAVDGAKRMQQLINDLLAFSRVGRTTTAFTTVDLGDAVDRARSSLAMALEEAGATIVIDGELPSVQGDRGLIVQLLQNLLGNGIKFRAEAPPEVRITGRTVGDSVEVTVADNGIGVDPAYAEKIFVIFQRLHGKEAYAGTGIGLALCRKIVEFHGGRLWLDTDAAPTTGAGATFRFTLPLRAVVPSAPMPAPVGETV